MSMTKTIYSVGHSTHEWPYFVQLLKRHGIGTLADIRSIPASRRMPWFFKPTMERALRQEDIFYVHLPRLGGRRRGFIPDSGNDGWTSQSFRAYADYALGLDFIDELARMERLGSMNDLAYMCSEHTHIRCHRRIVSDYLTARGWRVLHILSNGRLEKHTYTKNLCVDGERIWYPRGLFSPVS